MRCGTDVGPRVWGRSAGLAATAGGWPTRFRLTLTGTGRDGAWLQVREYGFFAGEVRARDDLARFLGPDDLQPVSLKVQASFATPETYGLAAYPP